MDAVRSTARLITQAAVVAVAVTERMTAAMLRCAVDRENRMSRPPASSDAQEVVSLAATATTPYERSNS